MTLILGIESSCDETAAAVVADGATVHSNVVASQTDLHAKYGGVVPEIACRAHIEAINPVVNEAIERAGVKFDDLSAVAVTNRPGLIGSLLIGVCAAKTLAWFYGKPLIAVDHIRAHAYSPYLTDQSWQYPTVALVVSGGHTALFECRDPLHLNLLGNTTDDAVGEAYDKVANILELGYPGGPVIDRLAQQGNPEAVAFPRSYLDKGSLDFSLSGIKTAVLYHVRGPKAQRPNAAHLSDSQKRDIAASFQAAVMEVVVHKTLLAATGAKVSTVLVGGGVAATSALRSMLKASAEVAGINVVFAPMLYCTDNAAMIAALAHHQLMQSDVAGLDLEAFPAGTSR